MSQHLRITLLSGVALIAAIYTASLAFAPLCSVFRSAHHGTAHGAPNSQLARAARLPSALAVHR